jgi:hypothetical protein
VGDDFEDPNWGFVFNFPKGNEENDGRLNPPYGKSRNGSLFETGHRGIPDIVQRTETPPGGLAGSKGALLIRTLQSKAAGQFDGDTGQDDLFVSFRGARRAFGGGVSPAQRPSLTARVYLPPFEQWERRVGASIGFRGDVYGEERPAPRVGPLGLFRGETPPNQYWPGIFVEFAPGSGDTPDSARLRIRADRAGRDLPMRKITADELGWWTFGMSMTADGMTHFYASPGVDDLTPQDYLASHLCYGITARSLTGCFFNIFNRNDGRTWSTPWVIDDPMLHVGCVPHNQFQYRYQPEAEAEVAVRPRTAPSTQAAPQPPSRPQALATQPKPTETDPELAPPSRPPAVAARPTTPEREPVALEPPPRPAPTQPKPEPKPEAKPTTEAAPSSSGIKIAAPPTSGPSSRRQRG